MPIFRLLWSLAAIVVVVVAISGLYLYNHHPEITTYQQCMDAGYPIMTSYPSQCRTPDGRVFVGPSDPQGTINPLIQVRSPKSGETIPQKFTITGSARGSWFFEAVFPITLVDEHGQLITQVQAHATEDWMTEEFVNFTADLNIPSTYHGPATLILENANPSGLPERSNSINVPVVVQ